MKNALHLCPFLLISLTVLLSGCTPHPGATQASGDVKSGVLAENLHVSKSLKAAVNQLREIHTALISDSDFPVPVQLKVVEVIHKTGNSGHSHYYLESQFQQGATNEHGDEAVEETIKRHTIDVDIRTVLTDIPKLLPYVAADSGLDENDWGTVKHCSAELVKIIEKSSGEANEVFRQYWRSQEPNTEALLADLEKVVSK